MINGLRIVGTLLGFISYLLLVNGQQDAGTAVNIGTHALLTPFNLQHKCWDMIGTGAFFVAVNVHSLLS